MAHSKSRISSQTWPTNLNFLLNGRSMMYSMSMFCLRPLPTLFQTMQTLPLLLLLSRSMMRTSGLWKSTWIPDGSETDSSSRSNGKASQRNMTLGRMLMILIPMLDLNSYRMISTTKRTSITDIQMPPNEPTLLPLMHNLPDNRGLVDSQWGCWPLVGGTVIILPFSPFSLFILTLSAPPDHSNISNQLSSLISYFLPTPLHVAPLILIPLPTSFWPPHPSCFPWLMTCNMDSFWWYRSTCILCSLMFVLLPACY